MSLLFFGEALHNPEVTMYRGLSKLFKVVRSPDSQYDVWHADAKVGDGWQDTGDTGTVNECWDYIEEHDGQRGFLFNLNGGD